MTLPLENQIRAAFAAERANMQKVTDPDQIPPDFECISNAWLTAHLCKAVPGAEVVGHSLGEPDEGTNNRRRILLQYNEAGAAAGLPSSIFAKATNGLRNRLMLAHSGAIHCEVTFYREVRDGITFETPRAFHAAYDPHSFNSIILLEDLGDSAFLDLTSHGSPDLMRRQLSLLARLHASGFGGAGMASRLTNLPSWKTRFSALMQVNLEKACTDGLAVCRDRIPADLWDRRAEIWPVTVASLDFEASTGPTLCHGDVHLHNWYFRPDGTLGISDWGVTHIGPWGRDLAYCLVAGLPVDVRRSHEDELMQHYLDALVGNGGPAITLDEARTACKSGIMTALAFWTMTAAPVAEMPDMQPADTALAFVERLAAAVSDWKALDFEQAP
ncbi:MAG: phosphotransferase [Novosphingobium sp.]